MSVTRECAAQFYRAFRRFFETCCDFREIGMPLSGKPPDSEAYALSRLNKVGKSEFRSVHVLFLCRYFARMHEYRFDETNHLRGASENRGSVIPGRHQNGEPGIHNPRPHGYGFRLAAFDLGFTRDRHHKMRTSATADVRWRAGMTPHMIRICGTHFTSSQDGRVSRPRRRRRVTWRKLVAAGNDMPPTNQKKQPTYKEH